MKQPILSIVIPTKDRSETLRHVLSYILSWGERDYEVVVQDNSKSSYINIPEVASLLASPKVKYAHSSDQRSAIENCDLAVRRAQGEFVTFIGDDDAPTVHCFATCEWMKREAIDCVYSNTASYTWPDMQHAVSLNTILNGTLSYTISNDIVRPLYGFEQLFAISRSGAQSMYRIPRLYHGIVRRATLDNIYNEVGTYFPGPVPDMANAVAVSVYARKAKYVSVPIVVSGQSAKSMSGRNSVRKHQGRIEDEPSLPCGTAERWDSRIPKYWCAPTIWAEAYLKACESTQQSWLIDHFAYHKVIAACLSYTRPKYWRAVLYPTFLFLKHKPLVGLPLICFSIAQIASRRLAVLSSKILVNRNPVRLPDVGTAAREIDNDPNVLSYLRANGIVAGDGVQ